MSEENILMKDRLMEHYTATWSPWGRWRLNLRLLLKREGHETHGVASPADALAAIESREFDAVLMDLNYARDTTSGQEGLDLLTRLAASQHGDCLNASGSCI